MTHIQGILSESDQLQIQALFKRLEIKSHILTCGAIVTTRLTNSERERRVP